MVIPVILFPVIAFGFGNWRRTYWYNCERMQCVWILRLKWMIVMNTAQKLKKGSIV